MGELHRAPAKVSCTGGCLEELVDCIRKLGRGEGAAWEGGCMEEPRDCIEDAEKH